MFKGTPSQCVSHLLISVTGSEAKVDAVVSEYLPLNLIGNVFDNAAAVEGNVDESFYDDGAFNIGTDSEDEEKPTSARSKKVAAAAASVDGGKGKETGGKRKATDTPSSAKKPKAVKTDSKPKKDKSDVLGSAPKSASHTSTAKAKTKSGVQSKLAF